MKRLLSWLCGHGVHVRRSTIYFVDLYEGRRVPGVQCSDCGAPL